MDTMSYIIGRNSAGGGTGSTPSWSDVTNKPFSTVGEGLEVSNGALKEAVPVYTESGERVITVTKGVELNREQVYLPQWYGIFGIQKPVDLTSVDILFYYNGVQTQWSIDFTTPQTLTDSQDNTWTTTSNLEYEYDNEYGYYIKFTLVNGPNEVGSVRIAIGGSSDYGLTQEFSYTNTWNGYNINMLLQNATTYPVIPNISFGYWCGVSYSQSLVEASASNVDVSQPVTITDNSGVDWTLTVTPNSDPGKGPSITLSTENLPSDFQYFDSYWDEEAQMNYNLKFQYDEVTSQEVVHQLPAQYIPIDNQTIINVGGMLRTSSGGVSNVSYVDLTGGQGQQIGTLQVFTEGIGADTYVYAPESLQPDNSTIQLNGSNQLETVIPVCPTTTAGTFSLQATVDSNGNVTYSWV